MTGTIEFDHIAIAVERHRDAWPRYAGDLGGKWLSGGHGVGFAPAQLSYANGMKLEVLRPYREQDNDFLRRFLDRDGPGPHHLTFKVSDLTETLARATASGYHPIGVDRRDPEWHEAFLHPRDIPGVVVQLAQAWGPPWRTPRPAPWPRRRTRDAAHLVYVAHAVADLDDGLRLFAMLLGGSQVREGKDDDCTWVELAWPGPGRVRLLAPSGTASPIADWLGSRPGRIHHLAFSCPRAGHVPGAQPLGDGRFSVEPVDNLGVRLILSSRAGPI